MNTERHFELRRSRLNLTDLRLAEKRKFFDSDSDFAAARWSLVSHLEFVLEQILFLQIFNSSRKTDLKKTTATEKEAHSRKYLVEEWKTDIPQIFSF